MALFIWLSAGIHIDKMQVSEYLIEGLYIKLDKKLTIQAKNIVIPKRKENPSFDRINETLESIKYVLTFFNHIELNKIHFDNNILGIYFHDNILQLSSKDYLVRGNVHREGNMLIGTIPMLQLKKYDIVMRGEFTYNLHEDILHTEGKFLFQKTTGFFRASKRKDKIDFALSSGSFTNLKVFADTFDIAPAIKPWIVDNIQAKSYQVISLSGGGDIVDKLFKMNMDTLKAVALMKGVSILFKEGVAPVVARSVIINYSQKKGLVFNLEDPRYLGKNLDGSRVSIVNLGENNTSLNLNLKFDTPFDKEVQDLLKAYDIHVPVIQKSGKVIASLDAEIGLKKSKKHFTSDVTFLKGDVEVTGLLFPVEEGKLHYEDGRVDLKGIVLKHSLYEGVLEGNIDLENDKATFIFDAKNVLIKSKNNVLFTLKNEKIPFSLDYKNDIDIMLPKYALSIKSTKKETTLKINDLNKVKGYLSGHLPINEGGNIQVRTQGFETYTFKGLLKRKACFIYRDNKKCETRVPIKGTVSKNAVDFYAFNEQLHYNKKRNKVWLTGLNIDLEKFLLKKNKKVKGKKSKKVKNTKLNKVIILGKHSNLRYGEYTLLTDSYDVELNQNGDIKAIGSTDGDIIKFTKENDVLSLQALRIKDQVLHPLINFDGLKNGRYSISKNGNPAKVMHGEIIVEGGVMKGFKAYNNTLAFINTIPALAMLHNPGYSNEGFTILSGLVEYRMIERTKIIFDSIYIKGTSATIVGNGELDLKKNTINVELGVLVARELGKVVGSIPLVGYILVGKDKSVTVGLQITGSLDKPNVSISAAKDILSYPLELIKRTIEAPGYLLSPEK